jgi:hypothetical protein
MTLAHRIATAIRTLEDDEHFTIPEVFGERFLTRIAQTAAGVAEEHMREMGSE